MEDGLCGFVGTKQRLLIKDITKRFKLTILLTFQDFPRGKNKSTTHMSLHKIYTRKNSGNIREEKITEIKSDTMQFQRRD